jgi:hypothetical protein
VSSDFGQLAVSRHLISGIDCATAGAASAEAAIPAAPTLRNSRRFMGMFPPDPGILGRDATRWGVVDPQICGR